MTQQPKKNGPLLFFYSRFMRKWWFWNSKVTDFNLSHCKNSRLRKIWPRPPKKNQSEWAVIINVLVKVLKTIKGTADGKTKRNRFLLWSSKLKFPFFECWTMASKTIFPGSVWLTPSIVWTQCLTKQLKPNREWTKKVNVYDNGQRQQYQ